MNSFYEKLGLVCAKPDGTRNAFSKNKVASTTFGNGVTRFSRIGRTGKFVSNVKQSVEKLLKWGVMIT